MTTIAVPASADIAPGGGCRCDVGAADLTWVMVAVVALFRRRRA
jgi:MYXO-CTERM domain-containing protein